jgi:thiosulfate/3-mercaptopyruvate sulfurtransferase
MLAARRFGAFAVLLFCAGAISFLVWRAAAQTAAPHDPWTASQTVQPAALAAELGHHEHPSPPVVICVGFRGAYDAAHITHAAYEGPGNSAAGLAALRKWAEGEPRAANIVIYCGCCPMVRCPNVRPAFSALRNMGFEHVRVLVIPNNFTADWVQKGYPTDKPAAASSSH